MRLFLALLGPVSYQSSFPEGSYTDNTGYSTGEIPNHSGRGESPPAGVLLSAECGFLTLLETVSCQSSFREGLQRLWKTSKIKLCSE